LSPGGVDETVLPPLGWLREYGVMSPVIEGNAALVAGDLQTLSRRDKEAVRVLGVDILRDMPFREYELLDIGQEAGAAGGDVTTQKFLEILTNERSVVISEKLARRRGLAIGGEMRLMFGDRVAPYVVRGLLKDEGPARVLDGNFVMDIAAAQPRDRLGRIHQLDVLLPDGADLRHPRATAACRPTHRPAAVAPQPAGRNHARSVPRQHHRASWIALIVGLFLVYNTVTISVVARRQEIGTLRALGLTRRKVLFLFLGEAAALAIAGIVLGLGLARLLADAAVALTSATVSTIYIAAASAPPDMNWGHVWLAAAIGLPLSCWPPPSRSRPAAPKPPPCAATTRSTCARGCGR
jgi:putative ABC transport system permease protein